MRRAMLGFLRRIFSRVDSWWMRWFGIGILFQEKDEERMNRDADEPADDRAIEPYEL
jgi:hypothetical protein